MMNRNHPNKLLKNQAGELLGNQEGSAIVFAVMILVLLTIMGLMATNINVTENLIVRNDSIYKRNFYRAEAAANEAALRIENSLQNDYNQMISTIAWLTGLNAVDYTDTTIWDWLSANPNAAVPEIINTSNNTTLGGALPSDATYMAMAFRGVSIGSSLKLTGATKLYAFTAYGLCQDQGETLISVGYRKRF